jgi:hypothetical protein
MSGFVTEYGGQHRRATRRRSSVSTSWCVNAPARTAIIFLHGSRPSRLPRAMITLSFHADQGLFRMTAVLLVEDNSFQRGCKAPTWPQKVGAGDRGAISACGVPRAGGWRCRTWPSTSVCPARTGFRSPGLRAQQRRRLIATAAGRVLRPGPNPARMTKPSRRANCCAYQRGGRRAQPAKALRRPATETSHRAGRCRDSDRRRR